MVLYEVRDGVAIITLNRPNALNAFDAMMRAEFKSAIDRAVADESARTIVVSGAGRNFSAGADLGEASGRSFDVQMQIENEYKPGLLAIANSPKPVIAAVNGSAAGVGASYALACDLMVMAEDANIYMAFAALAVVPDGGATWQLLQQLGRRRAYELIISGGKLKADSCVELGLANRVVQSDKLLDEAVEWAASIAKMAPLALRYAKESLYGTARLGFADAISLEAGFQKTCFGSDDFLEGLRAFKERRLPVFSGS